jgi:hypothetical protein
VSCTPAELISYHIFCACYPYFSLGYVLKVNLECASAASLPEPTYLEPANNLRIRRGNLADGGSQSDCMQPEILPTEYRNCNSLSCSRERVWFFGPKWQDPVWRELDEAEADPAEQVLKGLGVSVARCR